jgi:anti-sigma-K factor RskA
LVVFITQQPAPVLMHDQLALFNDDSDQPLWLVSGSSESGQLSIKPINTQAVAVDNKAFELWMLPTSGQPKSLGLMPVSNKETKMVLSPQLLSVLQNSKGLAISIEPKGGSPTGLPTGPVVYQAPLIAF